MRKIVLTALAAVLLVPTPAAAQTLERSREAWRVLRESDPELFRQPPYVAPRNLPHRRVASGDTLLSPFYDAELRIENYAEYRLPAPYKDQAYIRYRNDVVRVNVRTGRVLQVYKDFFL